MAGLHYLIRSALHNRRRAREAARVFDSLLPTAADDVRKAFLDNLGYVIPVSLLARLEPICTKLRPRCIVEFGSGISTAILVQATREFETLIISIDQEVSWLSNTSRLIGETKRVFFASMGGKGGVDFAALSRCLDRSLAPELVLIDGPAQAERFSEEALILYSRLLASASVCIVDDTDRQANDRAAERLAGEFGLEKMDHGDPLYSRHRYSILCKGELADLCRESCDPNP